MPRPGMPRTVGAEERLRDAVRRYLIEQDRGPTWFARKMNEQGCPGFTNVTLSKVLNHGRKIMVDEAVAMAAVMGVSLGELVEIGTVS